MKKVFIIISVAIASLFLLLSIKDQVVKSIVTVAASEITGTTVHIDNFSLGVLHPSIRISGLTMYNPAGFVKGILIRCPKINVVYDPRALLKQKIHLVTVEFELQEMGLVKNQTGTLNVDSLRIVQQQKNHGAKAKPAPALPLQIDRLTLSMGKIVFKDYSVRGVPTVAVYDINIHKTYTDITSAQQLTVLILTEPMRAAGIKGAEIYAVAMLAGAAVLPVAIAATFMGKDSVHQSIAGAITHVYDTCLSMAKHIGEVSESAPTQGLIKAKIYGATVVIRLEKKTENTTDITVSARRYMLPKPDIAGGILYQITEKLKYA